MDKRQMRLMKAPSIESACCPFCGRTWENRHHIVPRSVGGGCGPTITVCGFGNTSGCHGLLHKHKLHLDYNEKDGWLFLKTEEPMKENDAIKQPGWRRLRTLEDWSLL